MEGFVAAHVLSRIEKSTGQSLQPTSQQSSKVTVSRNRASVRDPNFSDEALTLPKSTVRGVAEVVSESLSDKINAGKEASSNMPNPQQASKLNHLTQGDRRRVEPGTLKPRAGYARKGDASQRRKASKTNVATGDLHLVEPLKRLQACLEAVRETLAKFNRSREHKKRVYDRKAKQCLFFVNDMCAVDHCSMEA
jgi:hypothetical protein